MRFVVFVITLGLAPVHVAHADSVPAAGSGSVALPTDVVEPTKKVHPTELMRERQKIEEAGGGGRSGFWTSRRPAQGGAYRWRLLGIGIALIALMGIGIMFLIRRANRANAARPDRWVTTKPASEKQADRDEKHDDKPEAAKPPEKRDDKSESSDVSSSG